MNEIITKEIEELKSETAKSLSEFKVKEKKVVKQKPEKKKVETRDYKKIYEETKLNSVLNASVKLWIINNSAVIKEDMVDRTTIYQQRVELEDGFLRLGFTREELNKILNRWMAFEILFLAETKEVPDGCKMELKGYTAKDDVELTDEKDLFAYDGKDKKNVQCLGLKLWVLGGDKKKMIPQFSLWREKGRLEEEFLTKGGDRQNINECLSFWFILTIILLSEVKGISSKASGQLRGQTFPLAGLKPEEEL